MYLHTVTVMDLSVQSTVTVVDLSVQSIESIVVNILEPLLAFE